MDEAIEDNTSPEVLLEGTSGAHDDMVVGTSAHPSENVGAMDELVEADAVPDQHNKEVVEYEVLPFKKIGATDDLDAEKVLILLKMLEQ